jgi:NAD+ synthase (glutamine-hydrolysing)
MFAQAFQPITRTAHPGHTTIGCSEYRTFPTDTLTVVGVQMNPAPGDLARNGLKIAQAMSTAQTLSETINTLLVFPELALMGYPIRDVIVKHPEVVADQLRWLASMLPLTKSIFAAIGFVEPREVGAAGKPYYNSLALIGQGKLWGIVRKQLLPTYGEYEDWRTFEPPSPNDTTHWPKWVHQYNLPLAADAPQTVLTLAQQTIGFLICEDGWNAEGWAAPETGLAAQTSYTTDPIQALRSAGCDVIVNASASVARAGKPAIRADLLRHIAQSTHAAVLYVNQVGAVDECCFDGQTSLWLPSGEPLLVASDTECEVVIAHWGCPKVAKELTPKPVSLLPPSPTLQRHFADQYSDEELARTYRMVVMGIRDYFAKTGFNRALLGISGGIDSAVVLVLLADALGPDNVLAVQMPTEITPNENRQDASQLIANVGCPTVECPIVKIVAAELDQVNAAHPELESHWGRPSARSFATDNAQAISRATLLRLLGNEYNALPIATSDKSEFYLGYTTVNGDMTGALAPLGDVVKTKVQALARWMNDHRAEKNTLPLGVINRPPGADLAIDPATGKPLTAEAALMPYPFVDEVIWRMEREQAHYRSLLSTPMDYETKVEPLTLDQKTQWLNRFYSRMSANVFKWWLAPPVLLVDGVGSITKTHYHHPIVAGRIRWQGWSQDMITDHLNNDMVPN